MKKLIVEIPDDLVARLEDMEKPVQELVVQALKRYVEAEEVSAPNILKTRTWQLAGTLEVPTPEPEYICGHDETGGPITDYAEHVDDVLY